MSEEVTLGDIKEQLNRIETETKIKLANLERMINSVGVKADRMKVMIEPLVDKVKNL